MHITKNMGGLAQLRALTSYPFGGKIENFIFQNIVKLLISFVNSLN